MGDLVVEEATHALGPGRGGELAEHPVRPQDRRRVVGLVGRPEVRGHRCPPHEPRVGLPGEAADDVLHLVREQPGGVDARVRDDLPVDVLGHREIVVGAAVQRIAGREDLVTSGHPLVPARRDVVQRRLGAAVDVLARIAVEVLAHQRRPVAAALKHGRQRRPVVEGLEAERVDVAQHVVVVGVLAGQERRAARTAQWVRREGVLEGQPATLDQLAHVGHELELVPPHVVGLDHQHVRALDRWDVGGRQGLRRWGRLRPRRRGRAVTTGGDGAEPHDQRQHRCHRPPRHRQRL